MGIRFKISLVLDQPLTLPLNYRETIQQALYRAMPEPEAERAHHQTPGQRHYQKFTFSRLLGLSDIDMARRLICFQELYFYVSCLDDLLAYAMIAELREGIHLYDQDYPTQIEMLPAAQPSSRLRFLSPVTVRQTDPVTKATTYFAPNHQEFTQAIYRNLCHKYRYFFHEDYDGPFALLLEPASIKPTNAKFGQLYIKAYMGDCRLIASERALDLLYHVGLGEKNAQGFGMFAYLPESKPSHRRKRSEQ